MAVINLFGNSEAGNKIQQVLVANAPTVVSQQISPAADYISYDRTLGNVQVLLPLLSDVINEVAASGNRLSPNFMFADVTIAPSGNTLTILAGAGDNICGAPSIVSAVDGYRVYLRATQTGWLAIECPNPRP